MIELIIDMMIDGQFGFVLMVNIGWTISKLQELNIDVIIGV